MKSLHSVPSRNISDHLIVYNSKAQRRQVSCPRLHSSKINSLNIYRTLKFTKYFPHFFAIIVEGNTSSYMDKILILMTQMSTAHCQYTHLYGLAYLMCTTALYCLSHSWFMEGNWGCKKWSLPEAVKLVSERPFDMNSGSDCYSPAVGPPACCLSSLSLSIFECKIGK